MLFIRQSFFSQKYKKRYILVFGSILFFHVISYFLTDVEANIVNLIYWPVSYIITLFILGLMVPDLFMKGLSLNPRSRTFYHLIIALFCGVLHMLSTDILTVLLERLLHLPEHYTLSELPDKWFNEWPTLFHAFIWYFVYLGILYLIYYREMYLRERHQNKELKTQLSSAKVKTLSTELNPHFLFNAMNGITMQIRKGNNDQAVGGLVSLSQMLRSVLNTKDDVLISLEAELELLDQYIALEKRRFGDKLCINITCPEGLHCYSIPKLLLQPIVENAFKHGVSQILGEAEIKLIFKKEDDRLLIQIFNTTHHKMDWHTVNSKGIGLSNTVERLSRIYHTDYSFQVRQNQSQILVEITIPLQV
ncbi:MAG: histidine kinase [Bacteroidota bacterium]